MSAIEAEYDVRTDDGRQTVDKEAPRAFLARMRATTRLADAAIVAAYFVAAGAVTARLWLAPGRMVSAWNDEVLFEWMLAWGAHSVRHLENPLYTELLNAPDGVNLMANTSVLGLGVPLALVTLLFGPHTTFRVALVLSLAGTATVWYLLLIRKFVSSRWAAAVGGLFCGFAPGMISQLSGHLHMTAQFVVPAIIWALLRLEEGRIVRRGVILGLLVAYQCFISEEVLLFLALGLCTFVIVYAIAARDDLRRRWRPFLGGLGVGAATAIALLAYPLWFQFFGAGHYRNLPFDSNAYILDLLSYATYARQSLAGHEEVAGRLSPNPVEEASFLGLPLIVLCLVIVIWRWRSAVIKALAVCGLLFAALSLGSTIQVDRVSTGIPGPHRLVSELPLLDHVVPARFALVVVPIVGLLLALSIDGVVSGERGRATATPVRLLWAGALVAVLLPLTPLPLPTVAGPAVPSFLTSGEWRPYVRPGRTVVPVPPTAGAEAIVGMAWSGQTRLAFPIPGGYFIGPTGADDPTGHWGAPDRPLSLLLGRIAADGKVPAVAERERAQAIEDLRYWRADIVVLGEVRNSEPLRQALEALLGPGRHLSGAWVWDVRGLDTR